MVDNASVDGSADALAERYPEVTLRARPDEPGLQPGEQPRRRGDVRAVGRRGESRCRGRSGDGGRAGAPPRLGARSGRGGASDPQPRRLPVPVGSGGAVEHRRGRARVPGHDLAREPLHPPLSAPRHRLVEPPRRRLDLGFGALVPPHGVRRDRRVGRGLLHVPRRRRPVRPLDRGGLASGLRAGWFGACISRVSAPPGTPTE